MDNSKDFRFICTRCGNCCTDRNTIVNLTYFDILRLKNGLNLNVEEMIEVISFYIFDEKLNYEHKMVISPIETEKGLAFIGLFKKDSGFCYFYDNSKKKCLIYDLRPMFCRTFPFTFKLIFNELNKEEIKLFYTEKGIQYCPGIGEDAPLINKDKWIELGRKTIEELKSNEILTEQWNKAVRMGRVNPSVRNFLLNLFKIKKSL